ncbi:MAG TPA: hypothetical protein VLE44_01180 [Candidatus Saccharimonadales bacterium]|nr:hypothetical protein [Candidatus Saccharimonadales bacterium]
MKKILIAGVSLVLILGVTLFAFKSIRHKAQQNSSVEGESTSAPQTSTTAPVTESTGNISLNITSPTDNQAVATGTIAVTGTTSANAEVSVNESDTTSDSSGKFSVTVNLDEGENSIVIVVNDSNGSFIEKDLTVIYTPAQ